MDGNVQVYPEVVPEQNARRRKALPKGYLGLKRGFDIFVALLALPAVILLGIALLILNPFWNRGPLMFTQTRMGWRCRPFKALKFRTMTTASEISRGPNDPLETERITRLGAFLRRTRLDEFPQFINVLRGEMSVVGPRPDYWEHATHYSDTITGYRRRHAMRPGITGLAQVDTGYAEGVDATTIKTRRDLEYIDRASLGTDLYIFWRTLKVMLTGFGAR
jgi:lipopolysaccharide/colanic/teichoic acid biosynthesis glycosyltransferase